MVISPALHRGPQETVFVSWGGSVGVGAAQKRSGVPEGRCWDHPTLQTFGCRESLNPFCERPHRVNLQNQFRATLLSQSRDVCRLPAGIKPPGRWGYDQGRTAPPSRPTPPGSSSGALRSWLATRMAGLRPISVDGCSKPDGRFRFLPRCWREGSPN